MAGFYKRPYETVYKTGQTTPFKVSRSKIDFYLECPRCFWLDRKKQIRRPDTPPFQINKCVDELLKKEFDGYRLQKLPHPLMEKHAIKAIPFHHDNLNDWRENFVGVQYHHAPTNLIIFGAVDDIWVNEDDELIVVDYKATSKKSEVSISAPWQIAYKRQLEIYQWLLRQNGFKVSDTGYFVYTNGRLDADGFFDKVEFKTKVIPYEGNDAWIEPVVLKIKECLDQDEIPSPGAECEYCNYTKQRLQLTFDHMRAQRKTRPLVQG